MKKYSIIIPTLNESETLYDFLMALQALRNQCEIIIADAGSKDDPRIISLPLVDQFLSAEKGRAKQMNSGAEIASTDILIFLHADTYLPEKALPLGRWKKIIIQNNLEKWSKTISPTMAYDQQTDDTSSLLFCLPLLPFHISLAL